MATHQDPLYPLEHFPEVRYLARHHLAIWRPLGTMTDALLDDLADFIELNEHLADAPFDRFVDLTALANIDLQLSHVFRVAARRAEAAQNLPRVRSAIYANTRVGYCLADLYANLMERSTIDVRPFRGLATASAWLEVPPQALLPEIALAL